MVPWCHALQHGMCPREPINLHLLGSHAEFKALLVLDYRTWNEDSYVINHILFT